MEQKRVCVVGAGRWGKNHLRTLDGLGCLAGLVERQDDTRQAAAREFPAAQAFANVKDAVQAGFDGFTVATPAETHAELARYLLGAGQSVLVEKPLALRAAEARELATLARAQGRVLMTGHLMLFHPAIRAMRGLIQAGKLGKLQYLYSNRLNLGTVRTEENILWSFAPHDISIFQHLIGRRPEEVLSRGGAFLQPHVHDTTLTVLKYPDNVVAHSFVSWLHPFKEHRLVVVGSKGMLVFEDGERMALLFYEKGIDWVQGEPIKRDGPTEQVAFEPEPPLTAELRYFVERLGGAPVEIAGPESAVEVLEILEQASHHLLEGAPAPQAPAAAAPCSVHQSAYVDEEVQIGEGTKIWHFSHIQRGARIGRGVSIGQNVNVANGVRIGDHCKIQNNVSVYEGVELEDYVFCGPSMVFTNVMDPRAKYPQRGAGHYLKTLVREGASIGANATIVCGHTIGRHAFVAAGAVVACDVPNYALMRGVPARRVGWVCECGEQLGDPVGPVTCERCGRKYTTDRDTLRPVG